MPKPIKKKVVKKTKPEEDLKVEVGELKVRIMEKIRKFKFLIAGIGILLSVIAGIMIFTIHANSKASKLFYEGYRALYGSAQEITYTKGVEALKESYRLKPDPLTLLYIADGYYKMGSLDEALKSLEEFKKKYGNNRYLMPLCYQRLGMVYKKKGFQDEAIKVYDELYNKGFTLRDLGLYEAARLLTESKRQEEASKRIETLKKEFPNSPYLSMLKNDK